LNLKKHIFFDLDHTLWDFDTNSNNTLNELYHHFELHKKGVEDIEEFISHYKIVNDRYWKYYRQNKVTKEQLREGRFRDALLLFGIENSFLAKEIDEYYVTRNPYHKVLMPNAFEILDYLTEKKYQIHIISNGFKEIQNIKIKNSGLGEYISEVVLSEAVGYQKPHAKIFEHALSKAHAQKENSIMIGDNLEADIHGALQYGMDAIYYDPENKSVENVITISSLLELKKYL
jgi:putative hydrolase of the HAD superfamily